ncbi:GNAT family N-acetyltransferase [Pseudoalteromonas sp. SS15]|uniref:GNAT family N-acetyltransferase n=1 Tax=Pseudoalteromonas sp. SS15 TaxID=3139393 RepID=UPI003BA87DCD
MMIQQLNNTAPEVSQQIYQVFQSSYKIEAVLIGVENFPPLSRTVEHIQESTTEFYGFIVDGELAGVIEISLNESSAQDISNTTLEIESLTVSPLFFKQGIASRLIEFVLQNKAFEYAIVETAAVNQPAIKLYEKHGFKVFKQFTPAHGIEKVALQRG